MKKTTIILPLVAIVGAVVVWALSEQRGVSIAGVEIMGGDKKFLADRSIDFMEDLQFKDFKSAAIYHLDKTQKERDIPRLIQRVFFVKHEQLDIMSYKVLDVDLDRSKNRARVRVQVFYKMLGDKAVRDNSESARDMILLFYWFKQPDGSWTMELASSLE
jgi:hypothetical protein